MAHERIMVVERNKAMAFGIIQALEEAGYVVSITEDCSNGFGYLSEAAPELVIMVQRIPWRKSTSDVLQLRLASEVPIIAVGNRDDAVEMLESGVDAYVNTPASMIELVARVRSLLRHRRGGDSRGMIRRWDIAA